MSVDIRPATLRDASWVAANMREQDRREISAVAPIDSTARLAAWCLLGSQDQAFVAYVNDQPVIAFGMTPLFEGVGTGWAFGTNRMRRAIPAVSRFVRGKWAKRLVQLGYRRIEVRTSIEHDLSHRWLEKLGAEREGIARAYGRGGLDFVTYSFTRRP